MTVSKPDPKAVWATNIPMNWREAEIRGFFEKFGPIERVDIPEFRAHRKPFIFLHYRNQDDAATAIEQADNATAEGRILVVRHAAAPSGEPRADRVDPEPRRPPRRDPPDPRYPTYEDERPRYEQMPRVYDERRPAYDLAPERRRFVEESYRQPRREEDPREYDRYPDDRVAYRPREVFVPTRERSPQQARPARREDLEYRR